MRGQGQPRVRRIWGSEQRLWSRRRVSSSPRLDVRGVLRVSGARSEQEVASVSFHGAAA